MLLSELEPRWWAEAGRHKQGVSFLCPHCVLAKDPNPQRLGVAFANPIDGGAQVKLGLEVHLTNVHDLRLYDVPPGFHWTRIGDTFETLSLTPSVDCSRSGHWHGHITAGEIR